MRARTGATIGLALVAFTTFAQDVKVEKYRLPNGLTVILHPDHKVPTATIDTWFKVGSKDEPPRRSGFAHLFEHLMFMGTARVPQGQFDQIMESGGGSNNASTAEDRTNYYSSGPSNLLPTLLWLDADRMEALGKNIDQKKLDLQRDVVKNERRQNVEDSPYGKAFEAINGLMFPVGHPYHTSVIGSHEDLSSATVQDVQDFFSTFYIPNNASLVVAGDFDPAKIKPLIAAYYGTIPRANDVVRKPVPPIDFHGVHRTTMVDKVQQSKILIVWHSPAAYRPGDAELSLAASVLSDGVNSRLYQELVEKQKVATEVESFQESRLLGSLFYVMANASEGVTLDRLEKAIDGVLQGFVKSGPSAAELQRQSAKIEFGMLNGLQSVQNVADKLNEFEFYLGEPNSFKRVLEMYRSATPQDVRKWAQTTLTSDRLVLRVIPQSDAPAKSARDQRPTVGTPKSFTPQSPTPFTLSNGVKVFYWHRPELPLMVVDTLFRAGADSEPRTKMGETSLAADMLSEGAGSLDSVSFQNALDRLGASFGASVAHESASASLSVLTSNFPKALGLYADALQRPRFDAAAWQRVQRVTAAAIEQENDDPHTVATKVAMREFYGLANPAGRPVGGTQSSVKALKLADVREAYSQVFRPDNATIFAGGSLPAAKVQPLLDQALGHWKASGAPARKPAYAPPTSDRLRVVVIDRPGSAQTAIRFVMPGYPYRDPRRNALSAFGTVLGGTFTSRLNANLREAKGYTYGVGSRFEFSPSYGYLTAASDVRTDVTGASLKEFLAEFDKIRSGDVSEVEAGKAASTRRTEMIDALGTIQGVLGTAMALTLNGQPFTALGNELTAIENTKAAQINAVAPGALPMDRAVIVLVGDKNAILPQLEGLKLPTPEVVKAD